MIESYFRQPYVILHVLMEDTALLQMCATVVVESLTHSQDAQVCQTHTLLVLCYTIGWWDSFDITVRCENSCIHGNCVGLNQCSCEEGWQGNTCNERMFLPAIYGWIMTHAHFFCHAAICLKPCENGGECIGPNQCSCPARWEGETCDQRKCTETTMRI